MRSRWFTMLALLLQAACSREGAGPVTATGSASQAEPAARPPRADRAPLVVRETARVTAPVPATLDAVATAADTFESLQARYGDPAVVRETLPGAEGDKIDGWVLFPTDPTRRIEVHPDESGKHPISLSVREGSNWTRADGVRIGLDSNALQVLNGRPFEFAGFGWDYGGFVVDWKGGKLAQGGRFVGPVRLCEPVSPPMDYPTGDGEFLSGLAVVRAHPARVCGFGLSLEPQRR